MPRVIFRQLAFLMAFAIAWICFACFQFLSGSEGLTSVRMRVKLKYSDRPSDPSLLEKREDEYSERRQLALGAFLAKADPSNTSQGSHVGIAAGKHNVGWNRAHVGHNEVAGYSRRPKAVREVMVPDAKFITILREPSRQFESLYSYYGWMYIYKVSLRNFLEDPERYFSLYGPQRTLVAGRNPMCYDNGLDARHLMASDPRVEAFIASMGRWHDLVLIAEHFEESLVLLKELMCWTLDDVVFLSQNMRSKKVIDDLSPENQTAIRKWNWADTLLYDHFNATLWSKIDAFGISRMEEEVAELRRRNKALAEDCISKVVETGDKRMWYPPGIRIKSFLLRRSAKNKHLCEQLTRPEMTYLDVFRERIPEEILTRNRTFMNNTTFSVSRKKDASEKYLAKTLNKSTNRKLKYSRDMDRILAEFGARADTSVVENENRSGKRQGLAIGTGNTSGKKNTMTV